MMKCLTFDLYIVSWAIKMKPQSTILDIPLILTSCYRAMDRKDSTKKVSFFSHRIEARDLSPGDHVYVYRHLYTYQHHGIYTGEEGREVIHFSGDDKRSATVCATTLSEFLNGGTLRIVVYNYSNPLPSICLRRGGQVTQQDANPLKRF